MKMNLVFKGLGGESRNEDTTYKIRQFLSNKLDISHHVVFGNVVMVVMCEEDADQSSLVFSIRKTWTLFWKGESGYMDPFSSFSVNIPQPWKRDGANLFIPIMRQLVIEGAVTKLVRDKLYVNGVLYQSKNGVLYQSKIITLN